MPVNVDLPKITRVPSYDEKYDFFWNGDFALNTTQTTSALFKIAFMKRKKTAQNSHFLKTTHFSLEPAHYILHAALFTLHTTRYTLHTTHCILHTTHMKYTYEKYDLFLGW